MNEKLRLENILVENAVYYATVNFTLMDPTKRQLFLALMNESWQSESQIDPNQLLIAGLDACLHDYQRSAIKQYVQKHKISLL